MFDIDLAVLQWRRDLARERVFARTDLDELEDHLRAGYDLELELSPALPPARAFALAVENLGARRDLVSEFAKVSGRGWRRLLNAGRLLYLGSFFLPVVRYGVTLAHTTLSDGVLPGVQAFLIALLGGSGAVGVLSALTNVVMALAFMPQARAGRKRVMAQSLALLSAGLLNLSWLVATGPDVSDLFAGYYAWVASFGVAGAALLMRARELPAQGRHKAVALDG